MALKDPDQRFQVMRDIAFALEAVAAPADAGAAARGPHQRATRRWLAFVPWSIAVLALATTVASLRWSGATNTGRATRTVRFEIAPPAGEFQSVGSQGLSSVIAPDGRTLAMVVNIGDRRQLFVRSLESTVLRALPGTEDAANPFCSPDSRWIGFFANGG